VKGERITSAAILVLMLLVGAAAWWMQLRPTLQIDSAALYALPLEIGEWEGQRVPLESAAERMLDADVNLQRAYVAPGSGEVVWMYVGYYGTSRGGRPEHTPAQCYPSSGWVIESERTAAIDSQRDFRTNEWVVVRRGERRLVHFWYQSSRRTGMLGNLSLSIDHLRGRLSDGRADGALVRISTPLAPSEDAARARLIGFAETLEPLLEENWPVEVASN
jgi:EpsI family protein